MKNTAPAVSRKTRGMTLLEVMIAATISLFVVIGACVFMISSLVTYTTDVNRLSTNYDMRKLTVNMETDAAFASEFYIYDIDTNGLPSSATPAAPLPGIPVPPGQSGDLLLLVTTTTNPNGSTTINQVIAYCRGNPSTQVFTTTNTTALPVYRYATPNPLLDALGHPVLGTLSIATLYDTYVATPLGNIATAKQPFLPTATVIGNATNNVVPAVVPAHNNLFYNLGGGTVGSGAFMVLSSIMEQQNNQTVLSIDTYNLTMWPRS